MEPTLQQYGDALSAAGVLSAEAVREALSEHRPQTAKDLARQLIRGGHLTRFQAEAVFQGKTRGLVFGEYVVLDRLGKGGMGVVYKARHRLMDRVVAVKVLPAHKLNDEEAVRRFYREVQAAAKLLHPNIVAAFDAASAEGSHYLVMEYVEGQDLHVLVRERGRLAVPLALEYTLQAARGLAFAHERGVIHRDIKPANLLLSTEGVVKVLDMGLARLAENPLAPQEQEGGLTMSGQIMGTVDFMSPEQAVDTRTVDGRADIYSLGCTLHRLLTAEPMYEGDTLVKKLLAHREQPIPSLRAARPEVSAEIAALFEQMVAKRPEDRPASMGEVVSALERLAAGAPPLVVRSDSAIPAPARPAPPRSHSSAQAAVAAPPRTRTEDTDDWSNSGNETQARVIPPPAEPLPEPPRVVIPPVRSVDSRSTVRISDRETAHRKASGGAIPWLAVALPAAGLLMALAGAGAAIGLGWFGGAEPADETTSAARFVEPAPNVPDPPKETGVELPPGGLDVSAEDAHVAVPLALGPENPLTVEMWVTPAVDEDDGLEYRLWSAGETALVQRGDEWYLNIGFQQTQPVETPQPIGAWQITAPRAVRAGRPSHLAVVAASDHYAFYVDGRLAGRRSPAVLPGNDWPVELGCSMNRGATGILPFAGVINSVRLSRNVRYTAEFLPPIRFTTDSSTLAIYQCNAATATELLDSSGNGNHGILGGARLVSTNQPVPIDTSTNAVNSGGLDLSTEDAHVRLPINLEPNEPVTVELWVTPHQAAEDSTAREVWCAGLAELKQWGREWHLSGTVTASGPVEDWSAWIVSSPPSAVIGRPTHLAATLGDNGIALFVDGKLVGRRAYPALPAEPAAMVFGTPFTSATNGYAPFEGVIHSIRISRGELYNGDFRPPRPFKLGGSTIALYRIQETSGETLYDFSRAGLHGTVVGGRWVSPSPAANP